MSREHYHSWTEDRIAGMKRLWIAGHSAGHIAKELGLGVTRNAVIGKLHRMGLSNEGRAIPVIPKATYKPPRAPRITSHSTNRPPRPGPQNRPAVVHGQKLGVDFTNDPAEADRKRELFRKDGLSMADRVTAGAGVESPNARPFVEHRRGCRWPIGPAGAVMLCCNPVARGSYCAGHAAVAHLDNVLAPRTARREAYAALALTKHERIDRTVPFAPTPEQTVWDEGREAA